MDEMKSYIERRKVVINYDRIVALWIGETRLPAPIKSELAYFNVRLFVKSPFQIALHITEKRSAVLSCRFEYKVQVSPSKRCGEKALLKMQGSRDTFDIKRLCSDLNLDELSESIESRKKFNMPIGSLHQILMKQIPLEQDFLLGMSRLLFKPVT